MLEHIDDRSPIVERSRDWNRPVLIGAIWWCRCQQNSSTDRGVTLSGRNGSRVGRHSDADWFPLSLSLLQARSFSRVVGSIRTVCGARTSCRPRALSRVSRHALTSLTVPIPNSGSICIFRTLLSVASSSGSMPAVGAAEQKATSTPSSSLPRATDTRWSRSTIASSHE